MYNSDMELRPVPPHAYTALVSLVPEEPATLPARALLLLGQEAGIVAYVDDPARPTLVVVEHERAGKRGITLAGAVDTSSLAAWMRVLARPVTLYAPASLAARLSALRTDLVAYPHITFAPPSGLEATFLAMPPGGVRRLRPADARGLDAVPADIWGAYGTAAVALREGMAYARYLRAEIVSLACVTARTERYASLSAWTVERARRNGFARACAGRLIGAIIGEWRVSPLLTCATNDEAGRGLARVLDLTEAYAWTAYALE